MNLVLTGFNLVYVINSSTTTSIPPKTSRAERDVGIERLSFVLFWFLLCSGRSESAQQPRVSCQTGGPARRTRDHAPSAAAAAAALGPRPHWPRPPTAPRETALTASCFLKKEKKKFVPELQWGKTQFNQIETLKN